MNQLSHGKNFQWLFERQCFIHIAEQTSYCFHGNVLYFMHVDAQFRPTCSVANIIGYYVTVLCNVSLHNCAVCFWSILQRCSSECINFYPLYFVAFQLRLSCSVLLLSESFLCVFTAESIDLHICQAIMIVSPDVTHCLSLFQQNAHRLYCRQYNTYITGVRVAFVGAQAIRILKRLLPVW